MKNNLKKGFTLIELLVVIAIIGILSSVGLASINSARVKARATRRVGDIEQIKVALELFYDAKGYYPVDIYATTASIQGSTGGASMSVVPKDPQDSANYVYAWSPATSPTSYHLGANLEQTDTQTKLMDGDRDLNSIISPNDWSASGGFNGADAGSCADQAVTTKHCYDSSNI